MQQDFFVDLRMGKAVEHDNATPSGRLPVPGAEDTAEKIAKLLRLSFDAVIWCKACHPLHHCSFLENNPGSKIGSFTLISQVETTKQNDVQESVLTFEQNEVLQSEFDDSALHKRDKTNRLQTIERVSSQRRRRKRERRVMQQVIRPKHCVEGTRGSQFHPNVQPSPWDRVLKSCTGVQSKSPGVPRALLREILCIDGLREIYFAGIGVSPFVEVTARLRRKIPSVKIFALEDLCHILNMSDTGKVLSTDRSALKAMFYRAHISPIMSSTLFTSLKVQEISKISHLSWNDAVDALGYRLQMILDLEEFGNHEAILAKRKLLLELLHYRDSHIHNSMPPVEWLDRAGCWDVDVIGTLDKVSGESIIHTATRLGDIMFLEAILKGKENEEKEQHSGHMVAAKLRLKINSAENLPRADVIGQSDPYVVVKIGPSDVSYEKKTLEFTTDTKYKTLNPQWNETFLITPDEAATTDAKLELDVRVYDYDQFGSDDLLGNVQIPISSRNSVLEKHPLSGCSTAATITIGWDTMYHNHAFQKSPEAQTLYKNLTRDGHSLLTLAVEHGHGAIASMLIRFGFVESQQINHKVLQDRGLTSLQYACINGDERSAKLLLNFGAEPRSFSDDGTPTVLYATYNDHQNNLDTVETVIKSISPHQRHKALTVPDKHGWTALHNLCCTGGMGHLKWTGRGSILDRKLRDLDINAATNNGLSIMHLAAWNLSLETLRLLLQVHRLSDQIVKRLASRNNETKSPNGNEYKKASRFPVFVKKQLKTTISGKQCTTLDLAIMRYLDESDECVRNSIYVRALDCILVLCAANFPASHTVGSPCQRVFDRVLLSGNTSAFTGLLRSDDNAINIRKHHAALGRISSTYCNNSCTFAISNLEGCDQHMYYCRSSRTKVCQVCRDVCFVADNKAGRKTGLRYLGFLENGVCECQQNTFEGHRCLALAHTDTKTMEIKRYVPTAVLVPADVRARTVAQLKLLIDMLTEKFHERHKSSKQLQGWTFGTNYSEDFQTDPALAKFSALSAKDRQHFRDEVVVFVSTITYSGYNIINPNKPELPKPVTIEVLPKALLELANFLGHDSHEAWAEEKFRSGWHYAPTWLMNATVDEKLSAELIPFELLSNYHKKQRIRTQQDNLLDTLRFGYRIISVDNSKLGLLKQQLTPSFNLATEHTRSHQSMHVGSLANNMTGRNIELNRRRADEITGSLLLAASRWSLLPIISELLKVGVRIDKQDRFGYTALMLAVKRDHQAVAKLLIDNGANLEIRNIHHFSALMIASYLGNAKMVTMLLESGADLLATDHNRMMSIHHAAFMGRTEVVIILGQEFKTIGGYSVDICADSADSIGMGVDGTKGNDDIVVRTFTKDGAHQKTKDAMFSNQIAYGHSDRSGVSSFFQKSFDGVLSFFTRGGRSSRRLGSASYLPKSGKALFMSGSLSRNDVSRSREINKTNVVYEEMLSHDTLRHEFNPHELLADRSMAGIVENILKRKKVDGYSPLALAVKAGRLDVIQCLIKMGADPTVVDGTKLCPYDRALLKSAEEEELISADEAAEQVSIVRRCVKDTWKLPCIKKVPCLKSRLANGKKPIINAGTNKDKSPSGWSKVVKTIGSRKQATSKKRALKARRILQLLNESPSVHEWRRRKGWRTFRVEIMRVFLFMLVILAFSPLAPDHPRRRQRIQPLELLLRDSIGQIVGNRFHLSRQEAKSLWWDWHKDALIGGSLSLLKPPPKLLRNDTSSRATLRMAHDYVVIGAMIVEQKISTTTASSACETGIMSQSSCIPAFEEEGMFFDVKGFSNTSFSSGVPAQVALSTKDKAKSLETLSAMREKDWIHPEVHSLQTKFTLFRQSFDTESRLYALAAAPGEYYCHVLVKMSIPATGETEIDVEINQFSTPTKHRFAPSFVFSLSCIAMGCLFHLRLLLLEWIRVGLYRCVCNREENGKNFVEAMMMLLLCSVGVMDILTLQLYETMLSDRLGDDSKYVATDLISKRVSLENDSYSLCVLVYLIWNIIKIFPQAPSVGPRLTAIIGTISSSNQLVYLALVCLAVIIFSLRWSIALFSEESKFSFNFLATFFVHTQDHPFMAIFRIPFADEFINARDFESPRRPVNTIMEILLLVTLLVLSQNYIGLVVGNWERENKRANELWNAKLDKTLRMEALKNFQNNMSVKMAAKKSLWSHLGPALLLLGDDGLIFVADKATERVQGASDREVRVSSVIGGTIESISAISSSVGSMQTHIPGLKRDVRDMLASTRGMLARMRLRHASQRIKKIAFQASRNRGLLGLAKAPPQGKLPPKPTENSKISLGNSNFEESRAGESVMPAQLKTPKPPPDRKQNFA